MSVSSTSAIVKVDPFSRPASIYKHLKEGDIVRCYMPTDRMKNGERENILRNVLVHGIRINSDTHEPSGIYVSRLAFASSSIDHETDLIIHPDNYKLGRVRKRANLIIKTKRIDLIPLKAEFFEDQHVKKIGFVSEKIFHLLRSHFSIGQTTERAEDSIFPKAIFDEWVIPSLKPSDHGKPPYLLNNLNWHTPLRDDFNRIMENLSSAIAKEADSDRPEESKSKTEEFDLSWLPKRHKPTKREQREKRRNKKTQVQGRPHGSIHLPKIMLSDLASNEVANPDKVEDPKKSVTPPTTPMIAATEHQLEKLVRTFNAPKTSVPNQTTTSQSSYTQTSHTNRLSHVQDFRTVSRANTKLLNQIWEGKYVFANIFSISDPDAEGQAFRPCVIVNAYQEQGKLCALDVIPCSNDELDQTKWGLPAYPLMTRSKKLGVLMADKLVRMEYTEDNFPKGLDGNFHEISRSRYNQLMELVANAKDCNDWELIGIQDMPQSWDQAEIKQTPSYKWLETKGVELGYKYEGPKTNAMMTRQYDHYFKARLR